MKKTTPAPTPSQKYLSGMPSSDILSGAANTVAKTSRKAAPLNPAVKQPKQPLQPRPSTASIPGVAARGGKKVERMAAMSGAFAPGMPLGPSAGANEPSFFGPLNSKAEKAPVKKSAVAAAKSTTPAAPKRKTTSKKKQTDVYR